MSIASSINSSLSGFKSITLEEVQRASLMRRKDSKYIYSYIHVPGILSSLKKEYRVLEIDGRRSHNYQTYYYDTLGLDMYHMHHRGRVNRHKIRFRKYKSTDAVFLEVKKKDAKGVTIKNRMQTMSNVASIMSKEEEFLAYYTPYENEKMRPVLENSFNRITLVNQNQAERITIDYQLWFSSQVSEESLELPGISIAEIKFENHLSGSPFHAAMRQNHIIPRRFSKYCIGMAMLNPELKQNLFKEKVRRVYQINNHYLQSIKN
ncbi:MAG: polyphosphate polymerase domain-containing protein [Bacteroidales bacterium]|nr:polyphosphate polymerase domain-containing protein [Bacteroidales bacterium]